MNIQSFFNRNWRYIAFAVIAVLLVSFLYTLRATLLPFMVGLVMAYLFMPFVRSVEKAMPGKNKRSGSRRVAAIIIVLVSIMGVFAFIVFMVISALMRSWSDLFANAAALISNIQGTLQGWVDSISASLPESVSESFKKLVSDTVAGLGGFLTTSSSSGGNMITGVIGFILGFGALPLFLFYLLKDTESIQYNLATGLPPAVSKHFFNVLRIVESVLGRWARQELMLGAVVGTLTLVGLLIIRVPFAPLLAVINGIFEVVPTVGPLIGGLVMALITLALAPDKVIWVIALAFAVQLLENQVLVPRIAGNYMRLHPTVILVLLVVAAYYWGVWGMVLIVPLTATVVELFKYVRCLSHQANETCLNACSDNSETYHPPG
jgi:predicted PurR-regulated permease PerM